MGSRDPTKSSAKCQDFIHKFSSFCSCLSMLLVIALFLRVEVVRDKTEENEMRISRFESDIKSQQTVIQQGPDDKKETQSTEDFTYDVSYYRQKRDVNPATSPLSLKQIHQEIDKKLAQVCTAADKVCQPGPRGPPGDPGALGYPGYKGDKGSPGKKGSRGRIGKTGPYGVRGKDGPQGQQGIRGEKGEIGSVGPLGRKGNVGPKGQQGLTGSVGLKGNRGEKGSVGNRGEKGVRGKEGPQGQLGIKGEKGEQGSVGPLGRKGDVGPNGQQGLKGSVGLKGNRGEKGSVGNRGEKGVKGKEGPQGQQGIKGKKGKQGSVGPLGRKGDVGLMGQQGLKGSVGLKGNRGEKGSLGIQGTKGECVMFPKIVVFPELLEVFVNKSAVFYCWVRGVTFTSKISWNKLDGASLTNTVIRNGVLHIRHVTKSHAGALMCTALTSHGTMKAFATLRLLERPSFTSTPPPFVHVRLGSSLNVCCEAQGSPIPKVEWFNVWHSSIVDYSHQEGCVTINHMYLRQSLQLTCRATNIYGMTETKTTIIHTGYLPRASCNELWETEGIMEDGEYWLRKQQHRYYFKAYCHMTSDGKMWTLIARFSNNDGKNWMREDGWWWYDQQSAVGDTFRSYRNDDMISPAFWLSSGREIKITRSDDVSHASLLQTTGNCLGGQTFRSKITGYGNFRHGKVWSSDRCLGSCTVQYGGQYKSTDGFQQAECSGNIQTSNKIGFWCDWASGDGAVMMIGGGGTDCARSDHGIGITESNGASFENSDVECDFGNEPGRKVAHSYSLNLWIY